MEPLSCDKKELAEEVECPVDPAKLPLDAVRVEDETVVVQDAEIKPRNPRFTRYVYYSESESRHFRGPLPTFTTLVQTSKKLGISAYAYLRGRLHQRFELPSFAETIKASVQTANLQPAGR